MDKPTASKPRRLRELIAQGTVVLPGAFNALTAMQIERAGFAAAYVSGAGIAAARGLPDIGLLSMAEVVADAGAIPRSVAIPALADADGRGVRAGRPGGDPSGGPGEPQEVRAPAGQAPGVRR